VERRAHDDLARVKSFFLVETFSLGNFRRQLVKTDGGNPDVDDFGVRVERYGAQRKSEKPWSRVSASFFVTPLIVQTVQSGYDVSRYQRAPYSPDQLSFL
jgi:hypothetical protein